MARPPAISAPVRRIIARELDRIERLQEDAEKKGVDYPLSDGDVKTLEAAAKVSALLERTREEKERGEEEKAPATVQDKAAVLAMLEAKVPAKVSREAQGEDDGT